MGVETTSLTISAFVCGALSIAALLKNPRSSVCISFSALNFSLFLHDLFCVIERYQSVIPFNSPELHGASILAAGPTSLWFLFSIMPRQRKTWARLLWIYALGLLLAFAFVLFPAEMHSEHWTVPFSHGLALLHSIVWVICLSLAVRTPITRQRLRYKYTLIGSLVTIAFFITDLTVLLGVNLPPLGTFARVIFMVFLFQIYVQREFITADEVAARIALFSGVAVVLAGIYSLLVTWIGSRPDLFFFGSLIASSVILILFDPIRKTTQRFTRRLFLRRNYWIEKELSRLPQDLLGTIGDPASIAEKVSSTLKRTLAVQTRGFFLLERDGFVYSTAEKDPSLVIEIPATSPIIEYMALGSGGPFVWENLENERDLLTSRRSELFFESCRGTLSRLRSDLVLPFLHEGRLIGFLTAQTSERLPLGQEKLRLLNKVCRQVAYTLRNAEMFSALRDRDRLSSMGEMAAGLAHEIKNPLGAIKGAAEILQESGGETGLSNDHHFLDIIVQETNRLSHVLSEFLDYARPRRPMPPERCELPPIIEHAARLALGERNSRVAFHCDQSPVFIVGDPDLLKQVFLNLFLNATQAMDLGEKERRIEVTLRERNRKFVEIFFRDTGPGIPAEELERIFSPFFTTKQKGTGLGLAICRRLIDSQGGSIQARNHPSGGAEFVIHLPLGPSESRAGMGFFGSEVPT